MSAWTVKVVLGGGGYVPLVKRVSMRLARAASRVNSPALLSAIPVYVVIDDDHDCGGRGGAQGTVSKPVRHVPIYHPPLPVTGQLLTIDLSPLLSMA